MKDGWHISRSPRRLSSLISRNLGNNLQLPLSLSTRSQLFNFRLAAAPRIPQRKIADNLGCMFSSPAEVKYFPFLRLDFQLFDNRRGLIAELR